MWDSIVEPEVDYKPESPLVITVNDLDKKVKRWKNRWQ